MTDSTDQTTPADNRADDDRDQGKQGLQTGPDNFTDGYAPAGVVEGPAAAGYAPGAVSPATADALERALSDWSDTVTGPLERAAAEDAATELLMDRITAEQDAIDAAVFATLADADTLSPELMDALADAEAAPVCDEDDWSDWSTDGDDGAPGGDHR